MDSERKPVVSPGGGDLHQRITRVCPWLILVSFMFLLVFGPVYYGAVEEWQVSIVALTSILVFVCWSISAVSARGPVVIDRNSPRFSLALYLLPAVFTIIVVVQLVPVSWKTLMVLSPARAALNEMVGIDGSTPVSVAPHTGRLWLLRVIAYCTAFVVAAHCFRTRRQVLRVLAVIIVLGYLIALYGLLQYLSSNSLPSLFIKRHAAGRATGTYVNPNHFAGYLEMCTPLALSIVFIGRKSAAGGYAGRPLSRAVGFLLERLQDRGFILPLAAVVVMSLALVFSMSRMGIFSFAFGIVLFALLIGRGKSRLKRVVILGSIAVLILALSMWLGLDPVLNKYSLFSEGAVGRIQAWRMTSGIIRDYPLLGSGLGTFTHVSPGYQTVETAYGHWAQAHNDYLNLISDMGIIGCAAGAAFLLAWYAYVLKLLSRKNLRTYQRSVAAGCVAGVSAILVHSIADFNLQIPANAFYFATLLGLAVAVLRAEDHIMKQPEDGRHSIAGKVAIGAVAILLVLFAAPMAVRSLRAQAWLEEGRKGRDVEHRLQALRKSVDLEEDNAETHYLLGLTQYWEKDDYAQALGSLSEAVRLLPSDGKFHYRLAMAYARLGDEERCERELAIARKLEPMHPEIQYSIAYHHFFKWGRTREPGLQLEAFSEFRRAAEVNRAYLGQSLQLVAKYLPEYENLSRLVPDTPEHHRVFAEFLVRRGRSEDALKEYRAEWRLRLREDKSYRGDLGLILALARCYVMTGNVEDARRGYLKALSFSGNRARIYKAVGADFSRAKLHGLCLSFLGGLKEEFPGDRELDLEIARCHLALGNLDLAEKLLLELSESMASEQICGLLFAIAIHRKDYSLAEIHALGAVRLDPSSAQNYAMLARAREGSGDYEGAIKALRRALEIEPEHSQYRKHIERLSGRILLDNK